MINESRRRDIGFYRRYNHVLMDVAAHYININNRLWNAMKTLPGGLEAARSISLDKRRLTK